MNTLPANWSTARLPAIYETAKTSLAECSRIDECQQWADKAEALASYARQANDETLRKHADRIQARAIRRMGELLKQIPTARGENLPNVERDGTVPTGVVRAATNAGISERQRKTAIRVARVPADSFDDQVESEAPPTITELARQGTQRKQEIPSAEQREASKALAQLVQLAQFCSSHEPRAMARALPIARVQEAKRVVSLLDGWLDSFVTHLGD